MECKYANKDMVSYPDAYERSDQAVVAFRVARKAYRAMAISESDFLEAKKNYDAAMEAYAKAYAAEIAKSRCS